MTQPADISLQLKPHQLKSLEWMKTLEDNIDIQTNLGLYCDLAGYGKTIVMLALISISRGDSSRQTVISKAYLNHGYGYIIRRPLDCIKTTLIVVPAHVKKQWIAHIEQYTKLSYEIITSKNVDTILYGEYDVILCTPTYYSRLDEEIVWRRIVYDEIDTIKARTNMYNSVFIWGMTATPDNIAISGKLLFKKIFNCERLRVYYNYTDYITRCFSEVIVKCDDDFVRRSFDVPPPRVEFVDCYTPHFIRAIRNHITPRILDMLNAGNIDEAVTALGGNIDNDRNILSLITRDNNNEITILKAQMRTLEDLELTEEERATRLSTLTTKLVRLEGICADLAESINNISTGTCVVCLSTLSNATLVDCCNNIFCADCLLRWMRSNNSCPLCRRSIAPRNLHRISNETTAQTTCKEKHLDKMASMINILKNNGKFIVFSSHQTTFDKIAAALSMENITYSKLHTNSLTSILNNFTRGKIKVLFIDALSKGAGVSIPQATDIILYHQLPKDLETQVIARSQRVGRVGQLKIWKLRYAHEYKN